MLGYKNERCAQDSYHRFRREHFPRSGNGSGSGSGERRKALAPSAKKQYYADGRMINHDINSLYYDDDDDDDSGGQYDTTGDDDDGDDQDGAQREGAPERPIVVKTEDRGMERAAEQFWSLGFIDLEEEWEDFGEKDKIKAEPEIKKERVVEKWVWT